MHRLQEQTCALLAEHTSNLNCKWSDDTVPALPLIQHPKVNAIYISSEGSHHHPLCSSNQHLWASSQAAASSALSLLACQNSEGPNHQCGMNVVISDHHHQRRVSSSLGFPSGLSSLPLARKLLGAEVVSVAPSSFGSWM